LFFEFLAWANYLAQKWASLGLARGLTLAQIFSAIGLLQMSIRTNKILWRYIGKVCPMVSRIFFAMDASSIDELYTSLACSIYFS
jgi:hypothetical protein